VRDASLASRRVDLPILPMDLDQPDETSAPMREVRIAPRRCNRSVGVKGFGIRAVCSLMEHHSGACRSWTEGGY
jgi:hypothetical protein